MTSDRSDQSDHADHADHADHERPVHQHHDGSPSGETGRHVRFQPHELAIVLSHFDIGPIERIRAYTGGSRQAPKVRIRSEDGEFLLKRRAPGRDDPRRVQFSHELQVRLAQFEYPLPALVRTRRDDHTMLQLDDRVYELFIFVEGSRFDRSPQQTERAAATLGRMHHVLADFVPTVRPAAACYHAAVVEPALRRLGPAVVALEGTAGQLEADRIANYLGDVYVEAADRVEAGGYRHWPEVVVHGDWHPGNLRYRDGEVAAVLDFDSTHLEPRMADVANGALQFAMDLGGSGDPASWPEGLNGPRLQAFIRGYDSVVATPLDADELAALPWMIMEALVVETIVPIAATGRFADVPGSQFLQMIERKLRWVRARAERLSEFVQESGV